MPTPQPIADYACHTGEGPMFHPDEGAVYWTDIPNGRLFRLHVESGRHQPVYEGRPVGGFTVQEDGALLLFRSAGNVALWRSGQEQEIIDEIPDERETRFNDVIADPKGRVFAGTMPAGERPGRLYRLDLDGGLSIVLEGVGCSNGMGFSPDGQTMYHIDSSARTLSRFDYDAGTGAISGGQVLVRTPDDGSVPDGMTVDESGDLWVAFWNGGRLVRYSPEGGKLERVEFPVPKVSCVTFGGAEYRDMYVTTAGGHEKKSEAPLAGAIFHFRPGVRGVPEYRSRVKL